MGWAQELTIIMFLWMAKFGAAYGVRTGIQVGVEVLINRLSERNRAKFIVIGLAAGALFTGIFTPTEAAAMSAVYAFFVAVFVYRDLGMKNVPKVLLNSANMSAMLLCIITNAVLFSFLLTHENIPQAMAALMIGTGAGVIGFLIMANILMLIAGNFMEPSSIVLMLAPILFPIAIKLGIDPVHFGITKMGTTELTVAVWPWLLSMLVFLVVVTYVPVISLWLPRTLGMT
ncbi:TRAP transporter large permease subunit [Thauera sp. 2A1]|nr:TRAP transporter large permease subunit [Thauera sp. 2A1]KAI5916546.1 TRAP transporter large permease subunit [Thauera sp. 2A1]